MKYFFSVVSGSVLAVTLLLAASAFAQATPSGADLAEVSCRLVPKRDTSLSLSAREIIESVHHRLGDRVSEGDVLLELNQGNLVAQMRQAEVTLEMASQRLARADQMQGVLTVVERTEIESELLIAQIQLDGLTVERRRYLLRAPHDGVVTELFADVGEVAPDGPLMRLVQVEILQAQLDVPSHLRQALSDRETLLIAVEGGPEVEAQISFVDVLIEPVSQTFRLHALIENEDGAIIAGTSCRVFMNGG